MARTNTGFSLTAAVRPATGRASLPSVSYAIAKDALEAGDILNNPLPGTSGHVVLFAGWANAERTEYYAYEESPSGGAHLSQIPYPYWPGYGTFIPRRYIGTTSKAPAPVTIPERPAAPEPPEDGDLVRHDGQVYRIAGGAPMPVTSRDWARKLSDAEFADLAAQPADGTFLRADGKTYVVAGSAPVFVPRGSLKVRDAVAVAPAALDQLNDKPADGTVVKTDSGERYVFAGGAPIHVTRAWWKSLRPKPTPVTVAQETLDQAGGLNEWSHVRNLPADGTLLKVGADVYRVERGVPIPDFGVRGVPIDPAAIDNAGGAGPWSHLVGAPE